ncbi:Calcium-binding protein KIC [Rhynchospora pubera]|uniref:Calcium-binding protein KIC n=1 Tax=Rhynchospora pubera TaxID=906938 RepID=A0AAV8BYW4_9POAL|nr:Calcium-binding protein KIC [Rhynchospora pubera]
MANSSISFEDFLPSMAEQLGPEGLMKELCKGFNLLMDPRKGVITFDSIKENARAFGLEGLSDDELIGMVKEGDLDGDGTLDMNEFCTLMIRLSPELLKGPQAAIDAVLNCFCN